MESKILDIFTVTYKNTASTGHVVFSTCSDENFYPYQIKMISYNRNELVNIIPPDYSKKNTMLDFYYDITSKITLSDYLIQNTLTKRDVIYFLLSVTDVLYQCERYLLSAGKFVLDADYIYLNPSDRQINLVYIPISRKFDGCKLLKEFIISFISIKAKISTDRYDNYTQKILEYIKDDSVTIPNIKEMLQQISLDRDNAKYGYINEIPGKSEEPLDLINEFNKNHINKEIAEKENTKFNIKIPKPSHKNDYEKQGIGSVGKTRVLSVDFYIYLLQGLIFTLFAIGLIYIISYGNDDRLFMITGLSVIFATIEFLIIKKTDNIKGFFERKGFAVHNESNKTKKKLEKVKRKKQEKIEKKEKRITIPVPVIKFAKDENGDPKQEKTVLPDIEHVRRIINYQTTDWEKENTESRNSNTVLLSNHKKLNPYLTVPGSKDFKIYIDRSPFYIGRQEEQVNYVINNPAIGKKHAEFTLNNQNVFLKDLESKNGTFVNDLKIETNKVLVLKDGDRIMFANEKFIIFLTNR